jgi:hypothetical protein
MSSTVKFTLLRNVRARKNKPRASCFKMRAHVSSIISAHVFGAEIPILGTQSINQ